MEVVQKADVLFQKMGNTWFLFSMLNDEGFYSQLPYGLDPKVDSVEIYQIIEAHKQKERELFAS